MSRDPLTHIQDILDAIDRKLRYTEGMDCAAFSRDEKTQDAVIRNLEVIGEAARALPEEFREAVHVIPWRKVIALRTVLIHEYFGINLRIIWDVVTEKLPEIRAVCANALLEKS